jgi:hypothetical protein
MEYKIILPTLKIKINKADLATHIKTLKKLKEIINRQQGGLRLIIDHSTNTESILNLLLAYTNSDILKDLKFSKLGPSYSSILPILYKFDLDQLSIDSMSPNTFLFLLYCLSGEKSKIFNSDEFKGFFGRYEDFINWIDQEVQQKTSKLRKLKIRDNNLSFTPYDFFISLLVSVIETNPFLVSLKLPARIKDDVLILDAMNRNYTLLKTSSYVDVEILNRNKRLYDRTKQLAITFLALRSRKFKRFDKNLFEKIAKLIFDLRHDVDHLKALDNDPSC